MQSNRTNLLRWCIWFFLGNAIVFWIIGLSYIPTISWLDTNYLSPHGKHVLKTFSAFAYIGHLGILALLPAIAFIPLILILPFRRFIFVIASIVITLLATFLVIDAMTYKIYRFHLNGVILDFAVNGLGEKVWEMSTLECGILIGILVGLFAIELIYSFCLWRYVLNTKWAKASLKWILILLCVCLYTSYAMILYSSGYVINRVLLEGSRFLPLYGEVFGALLPVKNGRKFLESMTESFLIQPKQVNAPLNYPLQAIQCTPAKQPKNLVMIVIDTWRFDQVNPEITPAIAEFKKKSWYFSQHLSGGNCTGPGVFSLFYGLPVSYWTAMESQHQGPVFIHEIVKQNYQTGIFGSATLRLPPFNQTVFAPVNNLNVVTPGETPYDRDVAITKDFKKFIAKAVKNPQPFFGFLFYDAAHSYCAFKEDLKPLTPSVKVCNRMELTNNTDPKAYYNRYKNALMLIDEQIKDVFATLKQHNLLENTVVLITGDHGEEFNDNRLGYWGHASNFTRYQVQTPLIIYWPKEEPKTFAHMTSHFDIAHTLMTHVLGCNTSPENHSLGKSLFDTAQRDYLIVGSYTGFGVVEPDRITDISPTGNFQVQQPNGQPHPTGKLNMTTMQKVFEDLHRFYKKLAV